MRMHIKCVSIWHVLPVGHFILSRTVLSVVNATAVALSVEWKSSSLPHLLATRSWSKLGMHPNRLTKKRTTTTEWKRKQRPMYRDEGWPFLNDIVKKNQQQRCSTCLVNMEWRSTICWHERRKNKNKIINKPKQRIVCAWACFLTGRRKTTTTPPLSLFLKIYLSLLLLFYFPVIGVQTVVILTIKWRVR